MSIQSFKIGFILPILVVHFVWAEPQLETVSQYIQEDKPHTAGVIFKKLDMEKVSTQEVLQFYQVLNKSSEATMQNFLKEIEDTLDEKDRQQMDAIINNIESNKSFWSWPNVLTYMAQMTSNLNPKIVLAYAALTLPTLAAAQNTTLSFITQKQWENLLWESHVVFGISWAILSVVALAPCALSIIYCACGSAIACCKLGSK